MKNDVKLLKALPYQQCTIDDIVARIAQPFQDTDDLAVYDYGIINTWTNWQVVTGPLAQLRSGTAQVLANLLPSLSGLPVLDSECGVIPANIAPLVENARNQSINFREQFAALKVRLDSDDVADAHEFFGDILDVLLNAVYVVSIAVHVHSTGLESKFIRLFLLYRLLILWLSSSSKLHQPHLECIPKPNTGC